MKRILALMSLAVITLTASAQQISKEAAAQTARAFWSAGNRMKGVNKAMATGAPMLSYTAEKDGKAQFYIFNNSATDGFVIVGGDEKAQQILGYSNTASFDYDSAPANVKWWLSQYQMQICEASNEATVPVPAKAAATNRQDVEDLITTKWNQDAPFNSAIPNLPGATGYNAFATGCVATAMSQVMKKFEWPDTTGIGKNEYQRIYGNDTIVFSANFGDTHYAWEEMKDRYYSYQTADEVAKLMYHAGVSVNMEYGTIAEGGSGSYATSIAPALVNYFGYDKGSSYHFREHYTTTEWEDLIYAELVAGRPVIYSGQSGAGGHTFLCHGYDASANRFSINWGWGGLYDGYFALSGTNALKPNGTGIGGGAAGASYVYEQEVLIGIRPDVGGDYVWMLQSGTTPDTQCKIKTNDTDYTDHLTFDMTKEGNQDTRIIISGAAYNQSMASNSFEIGLLFIDENTRQSKIVGNVAALSDVSFNQGVLFTKETFASIFDYNGEYSVYPIFRLDTCTSVSSWKRVNTPVQYKVPVVTVTGLMDPEHIDVELRIAASALQEGKQTKITHSTNYTGKITYTSTPENIVRIASDGTVTALNEGVATITVTCPPQGYYNETIRDFEMTVTKTPVVPVKMEISGTTVTKGEKLTITHDPEYPGTITYSADPEDFVSISEDGVITALAAGNVRITAIADSTRFYTRTVEYFDITINSLPEDVFLASVNVPNNGYFTYEGVKANVTYRNNTGKNYSRYTTFYSIYSMDLKQTLVYGPFYITNFYDGYDVNFDYNIRSNNIILAYQMGLKDFKLRFTSDETCTKLLEPTDIAEQPLTLVNRLEVGLTIGESGWATLTLPYEVDLTNDQNNALTIYSCSEAVDNVLKLTPVEGGKLKMDTPYIIKGQPGSYTFAGPDIPNKEISYSSGILTGILQKDTVATEAYVLDTREYEGLGMVPAFYRVNDEELPELEANQAYVLLPTTGSIYDALFLDQETADVLGIEVLTVERTNPRRGIYTISGQFAGRNKKDLKHGIYIIDGKKVVK